MKSEDVKNDDQIVEEATDKLGVPDSQEESDDNWSPDKLSTADRAQYDKAVKAVDEFIENHPTYKQTEENQQAILDYLESHDLAITPASLELCWEQLQDRLDLEPEQRDSDEQPDASRLATAGLARGTKRVESEEEAEESEPEPEEPKTARGKPTAWRNGRRLEVGA